MVEGHQQIQPGGDAERAASMPLTQLASTPSRWKRRLYCGVTFSIVLAILELLSWQGLRFFEAKLRFDEMRQIQASIASSGSSYEDQPESIHPYLGWVLTHGINQGSQFGDRHVPINHLGFEDDGRSIYKKTKDRVIVAVCGGSVAQQMSFLGERTIRETLQSSAEFRGKELQFVRLAMSGYKQPQHLMALNYLLSLGAEFDVVVNVDGYNEIALSIAENDNAGVFAAYPRAWHARLQDVVDKRVTSISFRLLKIRAARQEWANWILDSWFRQTWTANLVWAVRDRWLTSAKLDLAAELNAHTSRSGRAFERDGPRQLYQGPDEMFSHVVKLWSESSLMMAQICNARGIRYVHCLQPNQYHKGSKPLSEKERQDYFVESQGYGIAVERGYPLMVVEGQRLRD